MHLDPMLPVYLPRRQGAVSDEDYDTGIAQNEEALNVNLTRLYGMMEGLRAESESLKKTLAGLRAAAGGR